MVTTTRTHFSIFQFMMLLPFISVILINSLMSSQVIAAPSQKARHLKWSVEYMLWSPDCSEERAVIGINGQFPGPTIRAKVGDIINLELTNKLNTEGVVIHWHGIRQLGTPWADGTALISQCPINPGETFNYRFMVDKVGTYFYHGHYGMQRSAGLYGSLIVEPREEEPFHYDGEFNLLLTDYWHQSTVEQETGLDSIPMRWIGEPQSLLINGRGQFNCSLSPGFANLSSTTPCNFTGKEQCAPQILSVLPNKTYRLRLASSTSLAALNLGIQNHKMTVVEADGNYIKPFTTNDIDIYSGETYSVLIKTDQNPNTNYWISIGVRGRQPKTAPALTILRYGSATPLIPITTPPLTPLWNNYTHSKNFASQILAHTTSLPPPKTTHRRLTLLNTQNKINGQIRWSINNISLILPPTPYLGSIKFRLHNAFDLGSPPDTYTPPNYDIMNPPINPNTTKGNRVYMFELNSVVDVVLQNANALKKDESEIHPWHLHGHDFWVLGYGEGKFMGDMDMMKLNYVNPPLKNTAVIFPYGWTVLRFVADNPGVWAFHCHIEPHLHMGMGVVFAQGVERVRGIPAEALGCGITAKMIPRGKNKVIN